MNDLYKKRRPSGGNSYAWLVTFADLISLLITFFVMIFATKNPILERWGDLFEMIKSNNVEFIEQNKMQEPEPKDNFTGNITRDLSLNLIYIENLLVSMIKQEKLGINIKIQIIGRDLVLSLPENTAFTSSSANLTPEAERAVFLLADNLRRFRNEVVVVGNSDPMPFKNNINYLSNWELAIDRAISVAKKMRASGYVYNINAYGNINRAEDLGLKFGNEKDKFSYLRRIDIIIKDFSADSGNFNEFF